MPAIDILTPALVKVPQNHLRGLPQGKSQRSTQFGLRPGHTGFTPLPNNLGFRKALMRCIKLLQRPWVALILVLAIAVVPLACGGASETPATAAPTSAPSATSEPPTSVPTGVPTAAPEQAGQTFEFPAMPSWVANGKYQPMVLQRINGFNPGQWDVHS